MKKAFTLVLLGAMCPAQAQLFTNNGAAIAVQNGAQLTVKGEVLNAASGSMANNGTIDLSGNWTNNAGNDCFGSSEGTVILNGTGQQIGGSSYTVFDHLQLVGGDVTLTQDTYTGGGFGTSRSGVLALNGAKLFLNSRLLGLTNAEPTAITRTSGMLVSETGPVPGYGRVDWYIGDHGPALYTIPFGNDASGHYLPLEMDLTNAGSGGAGRFTFATYPTDPLALPNNRPLPTGMASLTDLAGLENAHNVLDRFWIMDTEEYATQPSAQFTFTYRDSEWNTGANTIAEASLQAQRWDGTLWSNPPMGSVNTAANAVATPPVNLFAQVWALVQSSSPLPVELLAFTGRRVNDREVRLDWSTATEHDNAGFEVWRMMEGEAEFKEVAWVDGAGNSQQTIAYTHLDDNAANGISYYKLKQVDNDGRYEWSDVVAVEGATRHRVLQAHPNPCMHELFIGGDIAEGSKLFVLDALGRTVLVIDHASSDAVDVSQLPAGPYYVRAAQPSDLGSVSFIKR